MDNSRLPFEPPAPPARSKSEPAVLVVVAFFLIVLLPSLNAYTSEGSFLHVTDFTLNLLGKFLCFAILALGLDLIWGYTGILSLGQAVFFGLGAYCMGMHLMLAVGTEGVYQSTLPDFMVWNQVTELPLFWKPFYSFPFTVAAVILVPGLFAALFGFLAFRARIRGVYFAILSQALALSTWLLFNNNSMNLGGTNGLTDFKKILGFSLLEMDTQRVLYITTAVVLLISYLGCRFITRSGLGQVLVGIRDGGSRVRYMGYNPAIFKTFVFSMAACLAGISGALYVPQVGIITPGQIGVLPSLEMVVWVSLGGRGTLAGAALGAVTVNMLRSFLTRHYPDLWLYFLGALFVLVVMFFPGRFNGPVHENLELYRRPDKEENRSGNSRFN